MLDGRVRAPRHTSDVLHDPLRSFCLSSSRLSRNNHALVVFVGVHVVVGGFSNGEDMGRDFESVLVAVGFEDIIGIDAHCKAINNIFSSSTQPGLELTYSLGRG